MNDSVPGEPILSEPTGTFHYQELIESRLGQPIAADISVAEAARVAASPGARLAAGRSAMGWSIDQVASQLRLAPRQIISIEADDYAALPEPAVVRGFIRAYAKLVKLEPTSLIALISVEPGAKKARPSATSVLHGSLSDPQKSSKKIVPIPYKLLALALGLALLALMWFGLFV